MKKIITVGILGILILASCASLLAEINTSKTFIGNTHDNSHENFNCIIMGRVKNIRFFWIFDNLPIRFTIDNIIVLGWLVKNNLAQCYYEYPASGWLRINGAKGRIIWNNESFKGTIRIINGGDGVRMEVFNYLGVSGFTGFVINTKKSSEKFIIGYAKHVKLGPYYPY